ncbi:MAG: DUF433 domain-containing protein [Caldilineaceae bacterium]
MALALEAAPIEVIPLRTSKDNVIFVGDTRVTLDTVIEAFLDGALPEEIVYQYPSLVLADVYVVVGYYLHHQAEIDAYLVERRNQAEQVRRENERRFPPDGIRARLLARKHA